MSNETSEQGPLLCLMPGLGGSGDLFDELVSALTKSSGGRCQTLVIRYRDGDSLESYVDAVSRQLPTDRELSIVAESFSGPIAIALMARGEFKVGPSVLCNTFCRPPFRHLLPLLKPVPAGLLKSSALTAPLLRWLCAGKHFNHQQWAEVLQSIQSTDRRQLKRQLLALGDFDVKHLLTEITVPILYLQSTQDRLIRRRSGREITDHLTNCVRAEIEGPHLLLQMSGQKSADLILRHVSGAQV